MYCSTLQVLNMLCQIQSYAAVSCRSSSILLTIDTIQVVRTDSRCTMCKQLLKIVDKWSFWQARIQNRTGYATLSSKMPQDPDKCLGHGCLYHLEGVSGSSCEPLSSLEPSTQEHQSSCKSKVLELRYGGLRPISRLMTSTTDLTTIPETLANPWGIIAAYGRDLHFYVTSSPDSGPRWGCVKFACQLVNRLTEASTLCALVFIYGLPD